MYYYYYYYQIPASMRMRNLCSKNLSSRNPVEKQPTKEPMEFIISMKDIWPKVAPTRSVRSNRVGPTTPILKPQTGDKLNEIKLVYHS